RPACVLEDSDHLRDVPRPEDERWPEANCSGSGPSDLEAALSRRIEQASERRWIARVDRRKGAGATRVREDVRMALRGRLRLAPRECSRGARGGDEPVPLDDLDDDLELSASEGIAEEGVEDAVGLRRSVVLGAVIPAELHLLREGDDVRRVRERPSFVRPERS